MNRRKQLAAITIISSSLAWLISNPVHSQTCTQPFVLRQETCPSGISTCSTKAATLTYQELDRDLINIVTLCNGPGKYTWPTDASGLFSSNGAGVISIGNLSGDIVTSGSVATIQANSVGLATDTTGNYAAGDAEAGNATGLVCTGCVEASDLASDSITEAKLDALDSPADEECVTYEATGGRFEYQACGSGGSSFDPTTVPEMWDELCGRHTTENVYGSLGWTAFGGNGTGAASAETSHPCVQTLFTTTTSGNVQALGLGKFSTDDQIRVSDLDRAVFVVKIDNVTNSELRVGFMDDVSSSTGGDGAMIDFDASVDDSFRCVTRQGGTTTANLHSGAVAANTWYQLEIERTSGGDYVCYVNGTSFATNTTNLPTGLTNIGFAVETKTTAQRILSIDYFRLKVKTIVRY